MDYVDYVDIYFQIYISFYIKKKQIHIFIEKLKPWMCNRKWSYHVRVSHASHKDFIRFNIK